MSRDIQFLAKHSGTARFYSLPSGEPRVAIEIPADEECPLPFSAVGASFEDAVNEVMRSREKYIKNRDHVPMCGGRKPK